MVLLLARRGFLVLLVLARPKLAAKVELDGNTAAGTPAEIEFRDADGSTCMLHFAGGALRSSCPIVSDLPPSMPSPLSPPSPLLPPPPCMNFNSTGGGDSHVCTNWNYCPGGCAFCLSVNGDAQLTFDISSWGSRAISTAQTSIYAALADNGPQPSSFTLTYSIGGTQFYTITGDATSLSRGTPIGGPFTNFAWFNGVSVQPVSLISPSATSVTVTLGLNTQWIAGEQATLTLCPE